MGSHGVFEDFGRGRNRLERPGYWQKQVAGDLIFARGLLLAIWHPGWLKNRCGFACSPHFRQAHDYTPYVRSWTAEKTAVSVPISIRIVHACDDFSGSAVLQPASGGYVAMPTRAKAPRYPRRCSALWLWLRHVTKNAG